MTSKVYRGLSDVLGLRDESMVLSVFVRKIITNLKYWSHREPIVAKTLLLLNELCVGYSSVRKLVKLEEIQFILQNHTVVGIIFSDYEPPFIKPLFVLSFLVIERAFSIPGSKC
jgi:hypothetical protein